MNTLYELLSAIVDDLVPIGTISAGAVNGSANPNSVSIPGDGSWNELASFKLKTGIHIVKVMARFNTNSSGTRSINISTTSAAAADVVWNTAKQNASQTNYTYVHLITTLRVTEEQGEVTYYINGAQSSGSALTVWPRYGAVCVRSEMAEQGGGGGGGGGGTDDYEQLLNLPSIGGVTVIGDRDLEDYGLMTYLADKVDKVAGKGLSTNDYTSAEKQKLAGISDGAEANVQPDWNQTDASADDYIKNKPTIPPEVTIDSAMSSTSTNPVQNKVVKQYIDNHGGGGGGGGGSYHIAYDMSSAVGSAKTGAAKTGVPNYVPGGDVEHDSETIIALTDGSIGYEYSSHKLTLNNLRTRTMNVVSAIQGFKGSGVTFAIEED